MASVIPSKENIKRGMGQDNYNGYFDYFYVANSSDITTWPALPALDNTVTAETYMTATGSFGTSAVWQKIEVKDGSLDLKTTFPNLAESSLVDSVVTCMLDNNKQSVGFIHKYSGKDLQIILPALNGDLIWVGGKDISTRIIKGDYGNNRASSKIDVEIKASAFRPIYLAANTTINTVT